MAASKWDTPQEWDSYENGNIKHNSVGMGMGMRMSKKYTVQKIPTAIRFQAQMNPLNNSE